MKGILFSEPLFHKVVSGQKTQTRRIIKPRPYYYETYNEDDIPKTKTYLRYIKHDNGVLIKNHANNCLPCVEEYKPIKPRYGIGETLYLKEPYFIAACGELVYKYGNDYENIKWGNKLFMPSGHARYFIKITGISCERLQDISDEDCIAEGIEKQYRQNSFDLPFYVLPNMPRELHDSARQAYAVLIDRVNSKGTWESNPYVWVYNFKLKEQ